jgi:ADP-ribosylglycohydrolase
LNKNLDILDYKDRYIGCILGGAIGDSMGYLRESMDEDEISDLFEDKKVTKPVINNEFGKCVISDDTQLALFTMDGLLWAYIRFTGRRTGEYAQNGVWQSYARWYYTQTGVVLDDYIMHKHEHEPVALSSIGIRTILEYEEFYYNRNPSSETLMAIESGQMGTLENPISDFRDPSCLTRVAPVGLFLHDEPSKAFEVAAELAAITHGHAAGYLSAGVYATIIAGLLNGENLDAAVVKALLELKKYSYIDEVNDAVEYALHMSECNEKPQEALKLIGEGINAEEVLAMGLYCALKAETYEDAVIWAANCEGYTSSIGFIAGSLAGAIKGADLLNQEWTADIELKAMIYEWCDKLHRLREV